MATIGRKPPRKKAPKGDAKTIENGKAGSSHNSGHTSPKRKKPIGLKGTTKKQRFVNSRSGSKSPGK